jgi:fructose-1,6-bisphosphatase/inositol monophosphatase family enzyme
VAELGGGAWVDGRRVRANPSPPDPGEWHGIISRAFLPEAKEGLVDALSAAVARVHTTARCAGYEYPLVATGKRDFALYWRVLVWDHAPGALLLSEAGGFVTHLDGQRYDPLAQRSGLFVAHDGSVAETLLKLAQSH